MIYPEINIKVNAWVQHFHTKNVIQAELVHVDESDCDWRTADDNSELAYEWNVVAWEYINE